MAEPITSEFILGHLKDLVERKANIGAEVWMQSAFKLNLLLEDEQDLLEDLRQQVAQKKLEVMKSQEKRNVAAADLEVEASDLYRQMRLQEHKVDRIIEFVRLAKKNTDRF